MFSWWHKNEKEEDDFDILKFCKRHIDTDWWTNGEMQNYTVKELEMLIDGVIDKLKMDESLVSISTPCTIVGDIRGKYVDLIRILFTRDKLDEKMRKKMDEKKWAAHFEECGLHGITCTRYIFLGNYIGTDYEKYSLETICLLFSLKIYYPQNRVGKKYTDTRARYTNFFFLRGKHEIRSDTAQNIHFRRLLIHRFGDMNGPKLWHKFNLAFSWMPVAAILCNQIFCVHSGISPNLNSLDDIRKIKRPLLDINENKLAFDLILNNPMKDEDGIENLKNEKAMYIESDDPNQSSLYNYAAIEHFVEKLKIRFIVRSQQIPKIGFGYTYKKLMSTVFSAQRILENNEAAVLKLRCNGSIGTICYKFSDSIFIRHEDQEELEEFRQEENED